MVVPEGHQPVPADQFCDPVVTQSPLGIRHVLGGLQS
jgi:hypothetical protein